MRIALARTSNVVTEYQPDQVRIEEAVQQCLHESSYAQLSNVACRCFAGIATLIGQVPSFYLKQIAQTIARQVDGVEQVANLLEVAQE